MHAFKWYIFCIFIILVFFATIYGIAINSQKNIEDKNLTTTQQILTSNNQTNSKTDQIIYEKKEVLVKQKHTQQNTNYSKYQTNIPSQKIQEQELAEQNLSEFFKLLDANQSTQIKDENNTIDKNISKQISIIDSPKKYEDEDLEKKSQKAIYDTTAKTLDRRGKKPLLAIIIDDVSTFTQAELIKKIKLKITPSIFPVSTNTPNTAQIANKFSFYMIHLPMSAINYKNEEPNTMHITDSKDLMLKRIKKIKKDFPKLKFINNHTGSEFTSNIQALDKLMSILKSQDIVLLDSKTIAKSKVKDLAKKYNMPYLSRDVFLDNIHSEIEIKTQLKDAINIAKKRGYAIAIGHPHDITLKTINKNINMLKDVEIVYVDRLYKEIYGYIR
ncbi:divergent polysaccharide deacetylase family protein [Campylobacter sp. RM12327]|uniref:divergent polysaccharide deacetylase family protein n=1 Tax=Campylobacter sputorum TaxID=206 RepID=UPI000B781BFF|nr:MULTISPECIES: divergent polysaccharide deacetylase family protein [Campylobacter]ASM40196.1 divergent polysaccharide deacetylase [Campylobacter sputorum]MBE7358655.1 divergent polysaccharide deacetylase family protein [Campylobacter sp. RM11302]MBF6669954.1 divergent polysaccharide deacetylase family protein [Campylobacter sp. RM12327]MBF6678370.1 divergent polysaccharide deacetylase family protein [Campylobacter sp. RM11259]